VTASLAVATVAQANPALPPKASPPQTITWDAPKPPPAGGGHARGLILPKNRRDAIKGSYIVVLRHKLTREQVRQIARKLIQTQGGRALLVFLVILRGFLYRGSAARAARLAKDPRVQYVEQDRKVYPEELPLAGTQDNPPSWGLDRIDQRSLPLNHRYVYPNVQNTVNAYIIDSGVRITHREFQGRATWAANFTGDGKNYDCTGHGTHVAGTVAGSTVGVAKTARITALKVFRCDGSGMMSDVLKAVDWVTARGRKPGVVNMSLGSNGWDPAMASGISKAVSAGYSFAVAAGNSRTDACAISPALLNNVMTVGATKDNDSRDTSYSNYGKCVNIFAPGTNIKSASNQSDTGYALMSGTSMASPHVAGAAALVLGQNPNYSPQQVATCLRRVGTSNELSSIGSGSPNLLLRVNSDYRGCAG
jgi:subtilisin family serine protease